ncbi:AF4/FMR2 family member 4-like [Saccostrea cucullata]|uniref:AF4/FMR2 family member 4-like n=1 Tax=Saccostrea cuccullata TaxID=36930 RepID=UPI002ED646B2
MATDEEIIFEDHLYKLSGNKGKGFWSKNNPWKQKYFILKKIGDRPVLEYYNKKPKSKNSSSPKDKVVLWPSYRLEKVTNTRNRAYVFEVTTQDKYLCLSADEQRSMDIFVFILQSQMQLKKQIKDDMVIVQPENSESQRRIGAKGTNCILHVAPWGITLALQSTRSVLAQWPLKSVRYFEAGGQGKFMLEAGRVAPMGDGMYVFQTQKGKDNYIYDLLDQHIVNALSKTQPSRRGTTEEMEDYIVESEKLSALTTISPVTMSQPEIQTILQENWNFTSLNAGFPKPKPVVHVRQNSQMSDTGAPPPLPNRLPAHPPHNSPNHHWSPAQTVNHGFHNSVSDSLLERPPMPPPSPARSSTKSSKPTDRDSQTKPLTIPAGNGRVSQAYFRMNSSSSSGVPHSISSQFSPIGNWTPPPTFQEATAYSLMDGNSTLNTQGGYLTPRHSGEVEPNRVSGYPEQYILPTNDRDAQFSSLPRSRQRRNSNDRQRTTKYRLRSSSCDQLDSYNLDSAMSESPRRRSVDQGEDRPYDLAKPQAPFRNLHNFRGSMEMINDNRRGSVEHYYNINGLKGTVDASPNPTVGEVRKRFNEGAREDTLTRSISNPNFMQISTKDKFSDAKAYPSKLDGKRKSKSLLNLFRKSRDGKDRRSVGSSSNPSSPVGTLTRQTSIPLISIGGKDVYFTERSRSFRKPKNKGTDSAENTPPNSRHNSYSKASARDLPPSGSRHSSASKSPAISKKDLPPSGSRYTKSPAAKRRDLVNTVSPPLPKRERSSSYVNVVHSHSGSDISSNTGSNSIIHNRSGSDIGSSSIGSRHSTEMRHNSSSKAETVC